jgi:hypothetical protein
LKISDLPQSFTESLPGLKSGVVGRNLGQIVTVVVGWEGGLVGEKM